MIITSAMVLEYQPIGTPVGIFEPGKKLPAQIALKTDGRQWQVAGRTECWTPESLMEAAEAEKCVVILLKKGKK